MPRAPTITQDHVNAIANQLKAGGQKPTVRRIIAEHGSGSPGTVHPLLKVWEGGQPQQSATIALPPVLLRVLQEQFGMEVARATAEVQTQLADSEEVAGDLAREIKVLNELVDQREDEFGKLMDGAASQQGRINQLERDLAGARDEAARLREVAERAHTEQAKAELRLEAMPRLEAELAAARAGWDAEHRGRISAEQAAAVGDAQRDSLAQRMADHVTRLDTLEDQLAKALERERRQAAELTSCRVAVEASNARLEQADRTVSGLRDSLVEARASERKAIETAAELRGARPQ